MAVKKTAVSKSRKVAKQPAKKTVAKKVAAKSVKNSVPSIQAEEAMLQSLLGPSDDDGFCDEGPESAEPTTDREPISITAEETVIGDQPGDTQSEILAAADSDEGDDTEDDDEDEEEDELEEVLDEIEDNDECGE